MFGSPRLLFAVRSVQSRQAEDAFATHCNSAAVNCRVRFGTGIAQGSVCRFPFFPQAAVEAVFASLFFPKRLFRLPFPPGRGKSLDYSGIDASSFLATTTRSKAFGEER